MAAAPHQGQRLTSWLLGECEPAGAHLEEITASVAGHLDSASVWRIERPAQERGYGMCGRLTTYPAADAARAG